MRETSRSNRGVRVDVVLVAVAGTILCSDLISLAARVGVSGDHKIQGGDLEDE